MKFPFVRPAAFCLSGLVLIIGQGCRTGENFSRVVDEPAPLPESVRSTFGVMGVPLAQSNPAVAFDHPMTKAGIMQQQAGRTFVFIEDAPRNYSDNKADFKGTVSGGLESESGRLLFSLIAAGAVGALEGIFAGVAKGDLARCESALSAVLKDDPLQGRIQKRVREIAGEKAWTRLVPVPESVLTAGPGVTNASPELATRGIDSVLLIRVTDQEFSVTGELDPLLGYSADIEIRVVRASDGAGLHTFHLQYCSQQRHFVTWGDQHAKAFRDEMDNAQQVIADCILQHLFADNPEGGSRR